MWEIWSDLDDVIYSHRVWTILRTVCITVTYVFPFWTFPEISLLAKRGPVPGTRGEEPGIRQRAKKTRKFWNVCPRQSGTTALLYNYCCGGHRWLVQITRTRARVRIGAAAVGLYRKSRLHSRSVIISFLLGFSSMNRNRQVRL